MQKLDFMASLRGGWDIFNRSPWTLFGGALLAGVLSLTIVLAPLMTAGFVGMILKQARGGNAEMSDLFAFLSVQEWLRFFLGTLLALAVYLPVYLLNFANSGLGSVAGILAGAILLVYFPRMVDRDEEGLSALREGFALFKKDYLATTLLSLFFAAVSMIVFQFIPVAVILTAPITQSIAVAAYLQTCDDELEVIEAGDA